MRAPGALLLLFFGGLNAQCAHALAAPSVAVEVKFLDRGVLGATAPEVASGSLDDKFGAKTPGPRRRDYWQKLNIPQLGELHGQPVLIAHATRGLNVDILISHADLPTSLKLAATLPGFLGLHDQLFALPSDFTGEKSLYAHIRADDDGPQSLRFSAATLDGTLQQGAAHARAIALTVGALGAVALAGFLIWFILKDRLFILYAVLCSLQGLYIAYLTGQGFDWPGLSIAVPWGAFAWNVPVALSGAVACLFTREIADLKRSSPRVYRIFGWFALAFVILAFLNVAEFFGLETYVNDLGDVMFVSSAIFTVVVSFLAWRRGNRAAGWFLLAWTLLEGFTIATAVEFLAATSNRASEMLYSGLPLSMVLASILIALGVADRLRLQRVALSEAERRAQTDPLTGVLNRRSLIERLDAACQRAQARGLPIALLFIDLDHFKQINDTFGHPAGDACLRAIIPPIHAELRQSDVIGRYGGEEFVVILSSADAAAAIPIAQRIRERVANAQVDGFERPIRLTCSIGIAASDTLGVWGEHLIAQADAAVYVAKRAGRNQVQVARGLAA